MQMILRLENSRHGMAMFAEAIRESRFEVGAPVSFHFYVSIIGKNRIYPECFLPLGLRS